MLRTLLLSAALIAAASVASAQSEIKYGDNSSEWSNDGECDDRRFKGPGMSNSSGFLAEDIGHDADDCKEQYDLGRITVWLESQAQAATQCSAIDFGDDSSDWSNDGECDDMRFEGRGSANSVVPDDTGKDANDCRALCELSVIFLRDY